MTTQPIGVVSWVWTTSTVFAILVTAALLVVLVAHVLVGAAAGTGARELKHKLARAAIPLLGCFVVVIGVRLAIILIERPGP